MKIYFFICSCKRYTWGRDICCGSKNRRAQKEHPKNTQRKRDSAKNMTNHTSMLSYFPKKSEYRKRKLLLFSRNNKTLTATEHSCIIEPLTELFILIRSYQRNQYDIMTLLFERLGLETITRCYISCRDYF